MANILLVNGIKYNNKEYYIPNNGININSATNIEFNKDNFIKQEQEDGSLLIDFSEDIKNKINEIGNISSILDTINQIVI